MPAFYIVLQEKIPGVDATGLEGRALSKHAEKLEALAANANVRSLMSYFDPSTEDVFGVLGEDTEKLDLIPQETWFASEEGLKTVSALLTALAAHSAENLGITRELMEFQKVLEAAHAQNIRWHLGIDY